MGKNNGTRDQTNVIPVGFLVPLPWDWPQNLMADSKHMRSAALGSGFLCPRMWTVEAVRCEGAQVGCLAQWWWRGAQGARV
eukprot:6243703-Heterocapsa_arctica.AAC.1